MQIIKKLNVRLLMVFYRRQIMAKKSSRLTKAILETAKDMKESGIIDEIVYEKITMRHLSKEKRPQIDPITSEEIRALRERAHLSQSANFFTCYWIYLGTL